MASKVRLHVDDPLGPDQTVVVTAAQAHYLFGVMRLREGAVVSLINSRDGEWEGEVTGIGKRGATLAVRRQTRPLSLPPDLWLMFAPIKKARTDFIVEKAVELGARRILPVLTEYTNPDRVRQDKLQAHATEAAEQCGATYVPEVAAVSRLANLLADWDANRMILHCDETLAGQASSAGLDRFAQGPSRPWAILVGPEGGFSPAEQARLTGDPLREVVMRISLGPRILRADTAAVAALTLWQAALGDWR